MATSRYCVDDAGGGGGHFLLGLLTGTALGAAAAMLFTPKPGRDIRRDLGEQAGKFAADASNRYRRASDGAAEWARKASVAADEVTERGKELFHDVRDAVAKGADEAERYRQEITATEAAQPAGPAGTRASSAGG